MYLYQYINDHEPKCLIYVSKKYFTVSSQRLVFYDTLETKKFYKKFRVEVDVRRVTSLKKYRPAFNMLLKNAAGKTVCEFITTKGREKAVNNICVNKKSRSSMFTGAYFGFKVNVKQVLN